MTTVMPEGDAIRKAVKWISNQKQEHPDLELRDIVNRAILKFDLSPKDAEFLFKFYKEGGKLEDIT